MSINQLDESLSDLLNQIAKETDNLQSSLSTPKSKYNLRFSNKMPKSTSGRLAGRGTSPYPADVGSIQLPSTRSSSTITGRKGKKVIKSDAPSEIAKYKMHLVQEELQDIQEAQSSYHLKGSAQIHHSATEDTGEDFSGFPQSTPVKNPKKPKSYIIPEEMRAALEGKEPMTTVQHLEIRSKMLSDQLENLEEVPDWFHIAHFSFLLPEDLPLHELASCLIGASRNLALLRLFDKQKDFSHHLKHAQATVSACTGADTSLSMVRSMTLSLTSHQQQLFSLLGRNKETFDKQLAEADKVATTLQGLLVDVHGYQKSLLDKLKALETKYTIHASVDPQEVLTGIGATSSTSIPTTVRSSITHRSSVSGARKTPATASWFNQE